MRGRLLIGLVFGGLSVFGLARNWQHMRRPAYESHITGDAAVRAGYALVEEGQYAEAIAAIERGMQKPLLEVELSGVYQALADAYAGLDREGKGEPVKHQALLYQGFAHRLRGDNDKAAAAFAEAEKLRPDYALAYESLGSVLLVEGRYAEAVAQLERAIELDGAKAITRSNLACAYAGAGRFGEAELQYKQAERLGYANLEQLRGNIEAFRDLNARGE